MLFTAAHSATDGITMLGHAEPIETDWKPPWHSWQLLMIVDEYYANFYFFPQAKKNIQETHAASNRHLIGKKIHWKDWTNPILFNLQFWKGLLTARCNFVMSKAATSWSREAFLGSKTLRSPRWVIRGFDWDWSMANGSLLTRLPLGITWEC